MYARSRYTNKLIESLLNTGHIIAVDNGYCNQVHKRISEITDIIDLAGEVVITIINNNTGYSEGSIKLSLKYKNEDQVVEYKNRFPEVILQRLTRSIQFGNPYAAEFAR